MIGCFCMTIGTIGCGRANEQFKSGSHGEIDMPQPLYPFVEETEQFTGFTCLPLSRKTS
jgi:hypothetical protein